MKSGTLTPCLGMCRSITCPSTFIGTLPRTTTEIGLAARVNAPLVSPIGRRDWPLGFYSRELLFSVAARRGFVTPDRAPLPIA